MSLVSALAWIPRGACADLPRRAVMNDDEFARSAAAVGMDTHEADREVEAAIRREAEEDASGDSDGVDDDDNNNNNDDDDEATNSDDAADSDNAENEQQPMDLEPNLEGADSNADDELAEFNLDQYDLESDTEQKCIDSVFGSISSLLASKTNNSGRPPKKQKSKWRSSTGVVVTALGGTEISDNNTDSETDETRNAEDLALELEELRLHPTDRMLCVARTSDGLSTIEFQVCEEIELESLKTDGGKTASSACDASLGLYSHHDIMVPGLPLCMEYVATVPGPAGHRGAFLAVGTMDPEIELWDVNVIDALVPTAVLGNPRKRNVTNTNSVAKTSEFPKKSKQQQQQQHSGPVLGLSWTSQQENSLASASADGTVRIWDLQTCTSTVEITPHGGEKVCAVLWATTAPSCILTGGHDGTARFLDARVASATANRITIPLGGGTKVDPEALAWNTACATGSQFYVITEDGHVRLFDLRTTERPVWTLAAHDSGSSLALSRCGRRLATVGGDMAIKIWDVSTARPSLVHSRALTLGTLFSCAWCPDTDGLLAVGGANGSVVLDLPRNAIIHCNSGGAQSDSDENDGAGVEENEDGEDDRRQRRRWRMDYK